MPAPLSVAATAVSAPRVLPSDCLPTALQCEWRHSGHSAAPHLSTALFGGRVRGWRITVSTALRCEWRHSTAADLSTALFDGRVRGCRITVSTALRSAHPGDDERLPTALPTALHGRPSLPNVRLPG
jgi:hypothetical protein